MDIEADGDVYLVVSILFGYNGATEYLGICLAVPVLWAWLIIWTQSSVCLGISHLWSRVIVLPLIATHMHTMPGSSYNLVRVMQAWKSRLLEYHVLMSNAFMDCLVSSAIFPPHRNKEKSERPSFGKILTELEDMQQVRTWWRRERVTRAAERTGGGGEEFQLVCRTLATLSCFHEPKNSVALTRLISRDKQPIHFEFLPISLFITFDFRDDLVPFHCLQLFHCLSNS